MITGFDFLAYLVPGAVECVPDAEIEKCVYICEHAYKMRYQFSSSGAYRCKVLFWKTPVNCGFRVCPLDEIQYSDETVIARFP